MKSLSFDKMASVEGGCAATCGKYCPLAYLVLGAAVKSHSFFAFVAGLALKSALCTSCGCEST
ncbi:MAG: hypothetical protein SH818_01730 [Saprospiraceae bacterium]|nr:hypothetical protein [Saprospiraceae bacterium]